MVHEDRLLIRDAREDDLGAIHRIYNEAIVTTTATWDEAPWPWEQRLDWWETHTTDPATPVLAAEVAGVCVGFAALSRMSQKSGWRFTLENTIYIDPPYHGRGIGKVLLQALIDEGRRRGTHVVVASITSSNGASLSLHRRLGFVEVGTIREAGWKFGERHSTTYMQLILD